MTPHDFASVLALLLGLGGSLVGWLVSRNVGALDSTLRDTTNQLRAAEARLHTVELSQAEHKASLLGTRQWIERVEGAIERIEAKLDRALRQSLDTSLPPRPREKA